MNLELRKEKRRAAQKKYEENNKEKVKESKRKWNAKNKEKLLEAALKYYHKNKDNIDFKLKNARKTRDWNAKNPSKALEQSSKKRAARIKRSPAWLDNTDAFEIECIYIYAKALNRIGLNYHVDHIVPLQGKDVSGLHIGLNLQVIPAIQNLMKSNKFKEY